MWTVVFKRFIVMFLFILLLILSGALGGLIGYLIFFKGLRLMPESTSVPMAFGLEVPTIGMQILKFVRDYWELFAYILLGIAGALLVPLVNMWVGGLIGIKELIEPGLQLNDKSRFHELFTPWRQLIVFDYGIVFGFSANRLLGGLTNALISRIGLGMTHPKGAPAPVFRADFGLSSTDLTLGQKVPDRPEKDLLASGQFVKAILRGSLEFVRLVENKNEKIVFKNEEGDGSDRLMTSELKIHLDLLADLVQSEWGGRVSLRVTEAWDDTGKHSSSHSLHYEGRAVDLTTSDLDTNKLGRLGRLAVEAGFTWVYYENILHIHASVKNV